MPYVFCLFVFSMGLIELRVASHDHVEQDAALPALTGAFTHESLSKKLLKCQSSLKSCVIMCLKSSVSESCSWEGHALHAGDFPLLQHTWFKWIACDQNWFQTDMLNRTKSSKAGDPSSRCQRSFNHLCKTFSYVSCALGVTLHHPVGVLLAMANILLQFLPGTSVEPSFVTVELRTVGGDRWCRRPCISILSLHIHIFRVALMLRMEHKCATFICNNLS